VKSKVVDILTLEEKNKQWIFSKLPSKKTPDNRRLLGFELLIIHHAKDCVDAEGVYNLCGVQN
jgi:hypothetical protein